MSLFGEEPEVMEAQAKAEAQSRSNFWIAVAVCAMLAYTFGQMLDRDGNFARNLGSAFGSLLIPCLVSLFFKPERKILAFTITWAILMLCRVVVYFYN